ncbi:hypothetical protein PISL3812_03680 [Talaromyces islandicus]|uniref:Cytochrome b5 heme-binding domain-containing protein n=1 Tax=Talaromyces islandicus TaxID=28573 RepID=A0A0U1LVR8_TALIS|nr:hypothetical protein PISL3812_03680 [Talaromyces islandicus]
MESFTLQQLAQHHTREGAWITINGNVYDVTRYLDDHPGGRDLLLEVAGKDATEEFDYVDHSDDAREKLETLRIGTLSEWVKKPTRIFTETVLKPPTNPKPSRPRAKNSILAAVCGIALLGYFWSLPEVKNVNAGYEFWSIVTLAATVVIGGVAAAFVRKKLFDHGKRTFQYPPYYFYPLHAE